MTTNWYWRRIQKNLVLISVAFRDILPANRAAFCLYSSWSIESILSGLRGAKDWESTDWDHDKLFMRFKDYVLGEERKLKTILRRLAYNIDQDNTLYTLTGDNSPEKVRRSSFTRLQTGNIVYSLTFSVCDALAVPLVRAGAMDYEHRKNLDGVTPRVFNAGRVNMDDNCQHA